MGYDKVRSVLMGKPENQRIQLHANLEQLNSLMHEVIVRELKSGKIASDLLSASLPTLDNNIWSSLPQLNEIALGKFQAENQQSGSRKSLESIKLRLKRTQSGLFVETLIYLCFRSKPSFSILPTSQQNMAHKKLAILTFGDFETAEFSQGGASRYWGDLPTWPGSSATWVAYGHDAKRKGHARQRKRRLMPLKNYLSTLGIRLRVWSGIKKQLSQDRVFQKIRNEIRRGLLGQPALEASYLVLEIDRLLNQLEADIVLTPHENQLWERLLFAACKRRGLRGVGVLHSTPRFWDTRFMYFADFPRFAPSLIVSNSPLMPSRLSQMGYKLEKIMSAPSLRFQHLLNPDGSLGKESVGKSSRTKALVTLGENKVQSAELIDQVESSLPPSHYDISFRPHPAAERDLSRLLRGRKIERGPFSRLIKTYELFICDLHSSMALEFLACDKRTLVHLPKNVVNLSPLFGLVSYKSFFTTSEELLERVSESRESIDIDQLLILGSVESRWSRLLQQLVAEPRHEG